MELLCAQTFEKGQVVRVESEHSAMATCIGFSLGGARSFTASSSNGLAYMMENVFAAAFFRLPIVMMAVNRTLGPPWNIWVDHGDTLALRDSGWIQLYCEDNQEVFDTIVAAFRLAEDRRILLPVMVCQDAFILSHTAAMTDIATQESVDRFLPPLDLPFRLSSQPLTVGGIDNPHETEVHRRHTVAAMAEVESVYREVQAEFQNVFGRKLEDPLVHYKTEDADVILVSMGTIASTVREVVDAARERGQRVGSVRVRMFRPLPEKGLREAFASRKRIGILDRNLCPGLGGILWAEARALAEPGAIVQGYMLGLGGGDVRPEHVERLLTDLLSLDTAKAPVMMEVA